MPQVRVEKDSLGPVQVPQEAYWGAQTQRAIANFPVSGRRFPPALIHALGRIKRAAARVNAALGILESRVAEAIQRAASEVAEGRLDDQFPLDVFQTGSGTSTNMNANEVIANRANELLGAPRGARTPVHPNDHVNCGQSSNDVFPTACQIAAAYEIRTALAPALERLACALEEKARAFDGIVKIGRTHLMDATPVRLGQEFGGYAAQVRQAAVRLEAAVEELCAVPLGGTATGTGINTHPEFARRVCAILADELGLPVREAENRFAAQGARDAMVAASAAVRGVAVALYKIANDIRWMGSGPDGGLAELRIPELQPGSSIMPGKVNPVIPEVVRQVAAQVIGHDATIAFAGTQGDFELNVMIPVMAVNLLDAIALAAAAADLFAEKCVRGLEANEDRIRTVLEQSAMVATALNPHIGYDRAAEVVKESRRTGRPVRQIVLERGWMTADDLDRALDFRRMTEPKK
jgi:fumarate hydratase class II